MYAGPLGHTSVRFVVDSRKPKYFYEYSNQTFRSYPSNPTFCSTKVLLEMPTTVNHLRTHRFLTASDKDDYQVD